MVKLTLYKLKIFEYNIDCFFMEGVAQLAEHEVVALGVAGSSPVTLPYLYLDDISLFSNSRRYKIVITLDLQRFFIICSHNHQSFINFKSLPIIPILIKNTDFTFLLNKKNDFQFFKAVN